MIKITLLILAVSADAFAAAAAMGSAGIKIPLRSAAVISLTGTVFLGVSVTFADFMGRYIPDYVCRFVSSAILISLGVMNLFYGSLKRAAEKRENSPAQIKMYFDGTAADKDNSKSISCAEALALSAALSADAFVSGISAGLGEVPLLPLIVMAFAIGFAAVIGGAFIGKHAVSAKKLNLQRVCGVTLIILAFVL